MWRTNLWYEWGHPSKRRIKVLTAQLWNARQCTCRSRAAPIMADQHHCVPTDGGRGAEPPARGRLPELGRVQPGCVWSCTNLITDECRGQYNNAVASDSYGAAI